LSQLLFVAFAAICFLGLVRFLSRFVFSMQTFLYFYYSCSCVLCSKFQLEIVVLVWKYPVPVVDRDCSVRNYLQCKAWPFSKAKLLIHRIDPASTLVLGV